MFSTSLSNTKWLRSCVFISGYLFLFHWPICLFLCSYHIALFCDFYYYGSIIYLYQEWYIPRIVCVFGFFCSVLFLVSVWFGLVSVQHCLGSLRPLVIQYEFSIDNFSISGKDAMATESLNSF